MAQGFRWTRRGYVAELETAERRLLRGLFRDVITLLHSRADEIGAAEIGAADIDTVHPGDGSHRPDSGPDDVASPADRGGTNTDPFWELVMPLGDLGGVSPRQAPSDPALARLLPATFDDAEVQAEHRGLTEDAALQAKVADAQRALAALEQTPLRLSEAEAPHFARALNDVRLVLSARLGIEDAASAARVHQITDVRRAEDVESTMALLYNFTSWLLETLMERMLGGLAEDGVQVTPDDLPEDG
ncbi:MAG: DUF2017 family protein [Micrococcus sp.]|nr:DUF2017 family protein [Micrococcus sp.]